MTSRPASWHERGTASDPWAPPAGWAAPDPRTRIVADAATARRAAAQRNRRHRRSIPLALASAVTSAIVPGLGQAMQRRWRAAAGFGLLVVLALIGAAWAISRGRAELVDWSVDEVALHRLAVAGLIWGLVCAVAALDALWWAWPRARRSARRRLGAAGLVVAVVVALLATMPGVAGAWAALRQDALLDTVFAGGGEAVTAQPSPLAELGISDSTAVATSPQASPSTAPTTAPTAGPPTTVLPTTVPPTTVLPTTSTEPLAPGRWNIALLGGDAGPHRWGMRTDTMIVLSIDRTTGDLVSVSVPRNLQRIPVPAPLRATFPRGFDDLANALYTYVMVRPQLGLDPAQTTKGALAELLGIPIDNYILVDMTGFVAIINALGGVTLDLSTKVEMIPDMEGRKEAVPVVGPGPVHLDGTMALSFVRTRETDSDYGRMNRQRCLLASVVRQTSATDLALSYPGLAAAVEQSFRSDIPRERLGDLVRLFAKVNVDEARSLVLVPPVIKPGSPDVAKIRGLVAELLAGGRPTADPAATRPTC